MKRYTNTEVIKYTYPEMLDEIKDKDFDNLDINSACEVVDEYSKKTGHSIINIDQKAIKTKHTLVFNDEGRNLILLKGDNND